MVTMTLQVTVSFVNAFLAAILDFINALTRWNIIKTSHELGNPLPLVITQVNVESWTTGSIHRDVSVSVTSLTLKCA